VVSARLYARQVAEKKVGEYSHRRNLDDAKRSGCHAKASSGKRYRPQARNSLSGDKVSGGNSGHPRFLAKKSRISQEYGRKKMN
jgi:hypothetical protein